jgi:hypothetical protein
MAEVMAEDIEIPSWVPAVIYGRARELYRRAIEHHQDSAAAMIKRLACDKRMQAVWAKLRPAAGERQDAACLELFCATVTLMQHPILMQPYPSYSDRASRLRDDARALRKRQPRKTYDRLAQKLEAAAGAYDDLAKAELPHNETKRAVRDLAGLVAKRFGSAHHQPTATIASVAVGRGISADDVRNWLRAEAVKIGKKS